MGKVKYDGINKLEEIKKKQESLDEERRFNEMANIIKDYLMVYGHPHITIIATQSGIEIVEGIKAKSFLEKRKWEK